MPEGRRSGNVRSFNSKVVESQRPKEIEKILVNIAASITRAEAQL